TVLSTANFFDIIGKSLGPLLGSYISDQFGTLMGMASSIIFWAFLPLFWIPVLKNVIKDMDATEKVFNDRIKEMKKIDGN
ncbi:MAG: hypothetical protein ACTSVI_14535, partial [Promethearchaeota archaeon]